MVKRMSSDPWRVLLFVWMAFSTVSQIVSLASIADDIILWGDFMKRLIASYREVRDVIWGPVFSLFDWRPPKLLKDYLTLNALFCVSIAWAFYNVKRIENFRKMGSIFLYVFSSLSNFTVGGDYLKYFKKDAMSALPSTAEGYDAQAAAKAISKLGSPRGRFIDYLVQALFIPLVFASILCFSIAIPFLMRAIDGWMHRTTLAIMRARQSTFVESYPNDASKEGIAALYAKMITNYDISSHTDDYFHETLRKHLVSHMLATACLFLLVVFANYLTKQVTPKS